MTRVFMGRGEGAHREEGHVGMETEIGVRSPSSPGMARMAGCHQKSGFQQDCGPLTP